MGGFITLTHCVPRYIFKWEIESVTYHVFPCGLSGFAHCSSMMWWALVARARASKPA